MNKDIQKIKDALNQESYVQGFNAVPIFLNPSAWSGFVMKKPLGIGYEKFLIIYKKEYGEMFYFVSDLRKLWELIKAELKKNPDYLKNIKKKYDKDFLYYENIFEKIYSTELDKINDGEVLRLLKECVNAQIYSVGMGHLLEAVLEGEKEFKENLSQRFADKKEFNKAYIILTTPSKPSFIAKEEEELHSISKLAADEQENELKLHLKKYFWIRNSYAGPKELDISFFRNRLKERVDENNKRKLIEEKEMLLKKLNLSDELVNMVGLLDYSTIWQDERKSNILKTIGYSGKIFEEASRRIGIKKGILYYLSVTDVNSFNSLGDIKKFEKELEGRREGVFFLMKDNKEIIASKEDYRELVNYRKGFDDKKSMEMDIHGSIANGGTAIGKVIVCKDIASIGKVMKGDILVTSMTRPEFMPALKKAAAIVTDEGGITSHAAIVARELRIPAIIGTKIATKVLKNGMIVEVKANHGIVRILKRN